MMYDPQLIENSYHKFISEMTTFLPEGPLEVDVDLLERLDLLVLDKTKESGLTRYFNILESFEKLTLINDQFIIWIVPKNNDVPSKTQVLIALNQGGTPHLELAFVASDIYNSSKLVLRILEKMLIEIQENEESLKPYQNE